MTHKSCLGLHAGEQGFTAVLIEGPESRLTPFTVAPVDAVRDKQHLANLLAEEARRRYGKLPPAALSLEARGYQSQYHQTEFTDDRQIRPTLKYDVEEDFSIDAEASAVCYQRLANVGTHTQLLVHAAKREPLVELVEAMETAGLDPLVALPDLAAWELYIRKYAALVPGQAAVIVANSGGSLYLMFFNGTHQLVQARSVLVSAEAETILRLELKRSLPSLGPDRPTRLYYHARRLSVSLIDELAREHGLIAQALPQEDVEAAFAAGAALGCLEGAAETDFRDDGLPPRTLQQEFQKKLIGLAAAVSLLLVCLCVLMLVYKHQYAKIEKSEYGTMVDLYKKVRNTDRLPPSISRDIKSVRNDLEVRSRSANLQTEPDSAANMWLLLLRALATLPEGFDLRIDGMNCRPERIDFSGSVLDLATYQTLEDKLTRGESAPFRLDTHNITPTGSGKKEDPTTRRKFVMPLLLNRNAAAGKPLVAETK